MPACTSRWSHTTHMLYLSLPSPQHAAHASLGTAGPSRGPAEAPAPMAEGVETSSGWQVAVREGVMMQVLKPLLSHCPCLMHIQAEGACRERSVPTRRRCRAWQRLTPTTSDSARCQCCALIPYMLMACPCQRTFSYSSPLPGCLPPLPGQAPAFLPPPRAPCPPSSTCVLSHEWHSKSVSSARHPEA